MHSIPDPKTRCKLVRGSIDTVNTRTIDGLASRNDSRQQSPKAYRETTPVKPVVVFNRSPAATAASKVVATPQFPSQPTTGLSPTPNFRQQMSGATFAKQQQPSPPMAIQSVVVRKQRLVKQPRCETVPLSIKVINVNSPVRQVQRQPVRERSNQNRTPPRGMVSDFNQPQASNQNGETDG